ncbi:MAG: pilus assembly protein [Sphingomonadaceae bacterium]|nr:pilus assembly protein [Sphingomonadaceae bacterium]
MGALSKFCRKLRSNSSGNATLMVALGAPALIGAGGLAIDTAQWYMWKRELQHSVDQAAYAGAWALAREETSASFETRAEQEFDTNISKTSDFVSEPTIQIADYAGGEDNSVVVTATASKLLPFSSFLLGNAATVRASAQASFAEGLNYNACLVSLADEGTGTTIGGNATVRAQCGLAALSCDDDAIVIDGSASVSTDSIAACGTVNVPDENEDVTAEGVRGLEDIYSQLEPPTNDTPRTYKCTGKGKNSQASLLPGTYSSLVVSCTTVLASGIYVINGGTLDLAANYNVTGSGVMFVLKNGATMKLGGNGAGNSIRLTPMSSSDFIGTAYEDQADELSDILVFEHRDNNVPNPGHTFNGNSNSLIEGLIYLPSSNIRVLGTADVSAQCLQISAYTIDIRGNAQLETLCPINETTSVGTSIASVKLVR